MRETIVLGETNTERLYLKKDKFKYGNKIIKTIPTNLPNVDMNNLIARHIARYSLVGLFLRPLDCWLDIPCGSGYASQIFSHVKYQYLGIDIDDYTIRYARRNYKNKLFNTGNLISLLTENETFRIVSCIEGIEHISKEYQHQSIENLYEKLSLGGILIISTPQAKDTNNNPYHLHELTFNEFYKLLKSKFKDVQILKQKDINHLGEETTYLYGICKKE